MSSKYFHCHEHVISCSPFRSSPRATACRDAPLRQAIKQYVPRSPASTGAPAITIIGAAASGCPKELYEPLWDALFEYASTTTAFSIRGIWIADVYFQGQSGLLNAEHLGNEPHWFDWSRDILHFITHFRDEIKPPIIGIGHSMGASVLVNLATIHTSLFTSLVLTEAMVRRVPSPPGGQSFFLMAYAAALRQEHWPSREEAERYLRGRKAYRTWDPRVVDLYVRHGLQNQAGQYPLEPSQAGQHHPSSNVTLKTSATQEALGIARPAYPPNHLPLSSFEPSRLRHLELATGLRRSELNAFYRPEALLSFRQLAPLTPSALFIYGEHATQRAEMQADVEAETGKGINGNGGIPAGAVKSVMISDSGHFVPFEKVASVAAEAGSWITDAVRRWKFDQDREIEEWYSRDARFKQQLPKDYMYWMHQQFGRKLKRDTPKTKEDGILEASAKL